MKTYNSMSDAFDLNLKNIKVCLPNGNVLFEIKGFNIDFGSHILIRGQSGKGKTTLLHLMAGLFSPAQGEIHIGQNLLGKMSDNQICELRRNHIGIIFQKLNLVEHLTLKENVMLALSQTQNKVSIAEAALDKVQLGQRYNEACAHLSLGEQQRVAVARVIAATPQIVLADEPTSSLDEINADYIIKALKDSAFGKTLIVVSHDDRLEKHFDRVVLFEDLIQ